MSTQKKLFKNLIRATVLFGVFAISFLIVTKANAEAWSDVSVPIDSCGWELADTSATYTLATSISASGTCLTITSDGVSIDGTNPEGGVFTITGDIDGSASGDVSTNGISFTLSNLAVNGSVSSNGNASVLGAMGGNVTLSRGSSGMLITSNGSNGGAGGTISVTDSDILDISANGGTGNSGYNSGISGAGGTISVTSSSMGDLSANGADGGDYSYGYLGTGGAGGSISVSLPNGKTVGNIYANGGDGGNITGSGAFGGAGGSVTLSGADADLSGKSISALGGLGTGTALNGLNGTLSVTYTDTANVNLILSALSNFTVNGTSLGAYAGGTFSQSFILPGATLTSANQCNSITFPGTYYVATSLPAGDCSIHINGVTIDGGNKAGTINGSVNGDVGAAGGVGVSINLNGLNVTGNVTAGSGGVGDYYQAGGAGGAISITNSNIGGSVSSTGATGNYSGGGAGGAISIGASTVGNISSVGGDGNYNAGVGGAGGAIGISDSTIGTVTSSGGAGGYDSPLGGAGGAGGAIVISRNNLNLSNKSISSLGGAGSNDGANGANGTLTITYSGTFTYNNLTLSALSDLNINTTDLGVYAGGTLILPGDTLTSANQCSSIAFAGTYHVATSLPSGNCNIYVNGVTIDGSNKAGTINGNVNGDVGIGLTLSYINVTGTVTAGNGADSVTGVAGSVGGGISIQNSTTGNVTAGTGGSGGTINISDGVGDYCNGVGDCLAGGMGGAINISYSTTGSVTSVGGFGGSVTDGSTGVAGSGGAGGSINISDSTTGVVTSSGSSGGNLGNINIVGVGGAGGAINVSNSTIGSVTSSGGAGGTFGSGQGDGSLGGAGGAINISGNNLNLSNLSISSLGGISYVNLNGANGSLTVSHTGTFTHTNLTLSALSDLNFQSTDLGSYAGGSPVFPGDLIGGAGGCSAITFPGTYHLSSTQDGTNCTINVNGVTIDGTNPAGGVFSINGNVVASGEGVGVTLSNVHVTGTVTAGNGAVGVQDGNGGAGGAITIQNSTTGAVTAGSGGAGGENSSINGGGGTGGAITIINSTTGALSTTGGSAGGMSQEGYVTVSGAGGAVSVSAGSVVGGISSIGGSAQQNTGNTGGAGGSVTITGSSISGGTVSVNGGDGGDYGVGGAGGSISISGTNLDLSNLTISAIGGYAMSGESYYGTSGTLTISNTGTLLAENLTISALSDLNFNNTDLGAYAGGTPIFPGTSLTSASQCAGILLPGTYQLATSLTAGDCTLNLDGVTIDGTNPDGGVFTINGNVIGGTKTDPISDVSLSLSNMIVTGNISVGQEGETTGSVTVVNVRTSEINSPANVTISNTTLDIRSFQVSANIVTLNYTGLITDENTYVYNASDLIINGTHYGPYNGAFNPLVYYFKNSVDTDWNTLGNWWNDSGYTVHAVRLPIGIEQIFINGEITTNSSETPARADTIVFGGMASSSIDITVAKVATFNASSTNNGNITAATTTFSNEDTSTIGGTVTGVLRRVYTVDATTTRDFTSEGGNANWIIEAYNAIVNLSGATYSLTTNIFHAFANALFTSNPSISNGASVTPEVSIVSPVSGANLKWQPNISWGSSSTVCEYKMDGGDYASVDCARAGADILRPSNGPHTLTVKGTDSRGDLTERSLTFTYDNVSPVDTDCATSLDEASRQYYYLTGNVNGSCTISANVELRGAGHTVSGNIAGNGHNVILKNITVQGSINSNGQSAGNSGGNITIQNATTTTIFSNGLAGTNGGNGGVISVATSTTGAISANGANGTASGGNGGVITINYAFANASSTTVSSTGGNSTVCGYGGSGGDINLINTDDYVKSNAKGNDHSCSNPGGSSGFNGGGQNTGTYTPAYVPPVTPPAPPVNNPAQSFGGGTTYNPNLINLPNTPYVFGLNNPISIPVASVKDLKLANLPVFGNKKDNFSFESLINQFIFAPMPASVTNALKGAPQMTKYLSGLGINNQQSLITLKNRPVLMAIPKKNADIPDGLIMIDVKGVRLPIFATSDSKNVLAENATTTTDTSVNISLYPTVKGVVTATFNNQKYTFKKLGKTSLLSFVLKMPSVPGKYELKTNGAPLTMVIEVLPSKVVPIEKVKKQSVWSVLKFW